jgi:hypothetical protein
MFTQVITPVQKQVIIDIPDEYLGHRLNITVSELPIEESDRYLKANRIDLSNFKFDRDEANER